MMGTPVSSKSSVIALLCNSDLRVGTAVIELGNLNAMEETGTWGGRSQVAAYNSQRQGGQGYHNGQQSQSSNQNGLTHADLWHWLVDYSAPRGEIIRSLLNS